MALDDKGNFFVWGSGKMGQLGNNKKDDFSEPIFLDFFSNSLEKKENKEFSKEIIQNNFLEKNERKHEKKEDSSPFQVLDFACGWNHSIVLTGTKN